MLCRLLAEEQCRWAATRLRCAGQFWYGGGCGDATLPAALLHAEEFCL